MKKDKRLGRLPVFKPTEAELAGYLSFVIGVVVVTAVANPTADRGIGGAAEGVGAVDLEMDDLAGHWVAPFQCLDHSLF